MCLNGFKYYQINLHKPIVKRKLHEFVVRFHFFSLRHFGSLLFINIFRELSKKQIKPVFSFRRFLLFRFIYFFNRSLTVAGAQLTNEAGKLSVAVKNMGQWQETEAETRSSFSRLKFWFFYLH